MMEEDRPAGFNRWQAIYPVYLNSSRSGKDGRRIPVNAAVPNPTVAEIMDAMGEMGFTKETNIVSESKVQGCAFLNIIEHSRPRFV